MHYSLKPSNLVNTKQSVCHLHPVAIVLVDPSLLVMLVVNSETVPIQRVIVSVPCYGRTNCIYVKL